MENDKILLDYYTKSMQQHATITVAVVFGLFSVLSIVSRTESWLTRIALSASYILLGLLGQYEIERYKHYGTQAKQIARQFGSHEGEDKGIIVLADKYFFPHVIKIYWAFIVCCLLSVWVSFFW